MKNIRCYVVGLVAVISLVLAPGLFAGSCNPTGGACKKDNACCSKKCAQPKDGMNGQCK